MWQRYLAEALHEALSDTRVVMLTGARQTGKTTLVRDILAANEGGNYLTLDDGAVLDAARHDPEGLVAGLSGLTVLDEVQRAPELLLASSHPEKPPVAATAAARTMRVPATT